MNRKITSEYFSNSQKKTLRDYISGRTGRQFRNITEITKHFNQISSEHSYEMIRTLYNDEIDVARRAVRAKQARERRAEQRAIAFKDLDKPVEKWLEQHSKVNKFRVTVKGRNGHDLTLDFKHKNHFANFMERYIVDGDPEESDNLKKVQYQKNVFANVKVVGIQAVGGGCNHHESQTETLKTNYYEFTLFNPKSYNNDCFFVCYKRLTGLEFRNANIRKHFGLQTNTPVSLDDAQKIMNHFGTIIPLITESVDDVLEEEKYIILIGNHYKCVDSYKAINSKDIVTKRGSMFFDFETRETDEYWMTKVAEKEGRSEKLYLIKDTICCAVYTPFNGTQKEIVLTSGDVSSARQFIDLLNSESQNKRSYNIYAHNGSRFDFYFILSAMKPAEMLDCEINMRGTSVIRIRYKTHIFKDTCCFLTDSLSNLSKSFKAEHGKITQMTLHGKNITSAELCFYKHKLRHSEFMKLEHSDKEFWSAYVKYCMYDCYALSEIWQKFSHSVEHLLELIFPRMKGLAPLSSAMTIGSHAKRIVDSLNSNDRRPNSYKRAIEQFAGVDFVKVGSKYEVKCDMEKYEFLCKFKRGGISHCNRAGKHVNGITGVDIASQYPASMMFSMLPCGKSEWVSHYDENAHGFYLLENIEFAVKGFKPCATSNNGESLQWSSDSMKSLYIDSYTLKYLVINYGMTFSVVKGLVSNTEIASSKLFGKFINVFYEQKKLQDQYKDENSPLYNESLRSTCKLYLNSLSGKLVEDPSRHYSMSFTDKSNIMLNGVSIEKTFNTEKYNSWIVAGLMVYSYSKRLLFEYIHCLPQKHDSVIHVETDGIYFDTRDLETFESNLKNYSGELPCVKFGSELGNLKIEKTTHAGDIAYFLGKKTYCITLPSGKNIYRCKGMPTKALDINGNEKELISLDFYDGLYQGYAQTRSWSALKKELFRQQTRISAFEMRRTINPMQEHYFEYK